MCWMATNGSRTKCKNYQRLVWCRLRGLNSRPSVYKTTLQWRHASVPKLLAAPAHAAEGAGGQSGAGRPGQLGSFLWGFPPLSFRTFGLPRHLGSLRPILSHRSLHPKISFPAAGLRRPTALGELESWEFLEPQWTFRARIVLIAGSIRELRTGGSILPEHHEVARLQCRVANDLRPQRARDLVRGTSC
jgi:hypothetical protein